MPDLTCYHLEFPGGLHVGTGGADLEDSTHRVPADTLFAAWVDACLRLGIDPAALCAPFTADPPDPPFLLTSAFPRAGGLRFYPAPPGLGGLLSADALSKGGKKVRRIAYLSEGLLLRALKGECLDDYRFPADLNEEPKRGATLQGGALWFVLDELDLLPESFRLAAGKRHALPRHTVWADAPVPRVTVDRVNSASTIYHAGKVFFAEGCGLWFGVEWLDPARPISGASMTYREALARGLDALQADGLGGERSSGYGAFKAEGPKSLSLPGDARPGGLLYLLSRYHPRASELPAALTGPRAAYNLAVVGGWMRSPEGAAQRRKRLRLVAEGSLVCPPAFPAGDVPDVKPEYDNPAGQPGHPVYRCGLALGLAWPEQEDAHA